jgi:hypothetical protein
MHLLAKTPVRINIPLIAESMGLIPTLEFLKEIESQAQDTILGIEKKVQTLKKLHNYQSISLVDAITLRQVFPDRVEFIDSVTLTATPTRTGFTVMVTELYDGTMAEMVGLCNWLKQRYISVLPVATDKEVDGMLLTETSARFKKAMGMFYSRGVHVPMVVTRIPDEGLLAIASAFMQAGINNPSSNNLELSEITAQLVSTNRLQIVMALSSQAFVHEYIHQMTIARSMLILASTREFSSLSGLTERLVIISTAARILKSAKIIPLWHDTLSSLR